MQISKVFCLIFACFAAQIYSAFGGYDDYWRPYWSPPAPWYGYETPSYSPVSFCPPEIYYTNRLICYNSGFFFKSRNNQNSDRYNRNKKSKARAFQERLELQNKFNGNPYAVKNVILL
ncbi:uncharacterized protein LOC135943049 [Cloeon dipterum]|uniref:uncharacterized protein LOC135943049 n=1 Tax=Cloeon dipterum TaxID=197152 RepID=UPI0032202C03